MKLQGMSIIFALVIVPIILILSYYIQLQVDTINLQTAYDTKLLDSTYDAMSAFELNTANEDLSTVSDSLRTIIEASYNVFISNMATNLGMSNANKTYVEPFIPSVLYTLYDGYYICSPTKIPTVLVDSDGNAVSVGDKGVTGNSGNYSYTEPITDEEKENATMLSIHNLSNELDYGQLLYLKEGTTDKYTADINEAKLETKNVLKTYMPYSARYVGSNFDLTIIYTLDNYVTVEGKIGDVYYTKSGYIIPTNSINIDIDFIEPENSYREDINLYNQNDVQDIIENRVANFTVTINDGNGGTNTSFTLNKDESRTKSALNTRLNILNNSLNDAQELWYSINYNAYSTAMDSFKQKYTTEYFNDLNVNNIRTDSGGNWNEEIADINDIIPTVISGNNTYSSEDMVKAAEILKLLISSIEKEITNTQYELDNISAVVYYAKAFVFSKWVNEYLCDESTDGGCLVKEDNLVEVAGQTYTTIRGIESLEFNFNTGANIFDLQGTEPVSVTEIPKDCTFYQHKLNVIRMSIQYNLNLAMSTYNNNESYSFDYEMPVIQQNEWEQILSHISITTFMQGMKCGLKTYNNYKIVSSTNNDILTLPDDIYYINKDEFNNEESEYHRINCSKIIENDTSTTEYMTFNSKEVKYDKINNKNRDYMNYEYDHKNYACYDCINDGNYFNYDSDKNGKNDTQINIFDKSNVDYQTYSNLRKAFYIGVAKERNDTYKMNAVENSQGYEIIRADNQNGGFVVSKTESSLSADKIKAIELAIGTIYSTNNSYRTAIYTFNYNTETNISNDSYSIGTNNSSNNSTQSIKINIVTGKNLGNQRFNIGSLVPKCENNSDIYKITYTTDESGNSVPNYIYAEDQLKQSIKYIRIIYK